LTQPYQQEFLMLSPLPSKVRIRKALENIRGYPASVVVWTFRTTSSPGGAVGCDVTPLTNGYFVVVGPIRSSEVLFRWTDGIGPTAAYGLHHSTVAPILPRGLRPR
jgi:hypothetical protein